MLKGFRSGSRSEKRSTSEVGSNFRGSRSRSSVYTAIFIQDRDCDLDRDPVFVLRVNGVLASNDQGESGYFSTSFELLLKGEGKEEQNNSIKIKLPKHPCFLFMKRTYVLSA